MRTRGSKVAALLLAFVILAASVVPFAPGEVVHAETMTFAATGTVYYVDSLEGNDANAGTSPATAWQSLSKVNDTTFQPGDAILFRAGGIWSGMLHPKGSGSDGLPIQIDKYGDGHKPLIAGDGVDAAIYFYNQEYWEVRNLEITNNAADPGQRRGIHVSGNSGDDWSNMREYKHFVFENLDIHSVKGQQGGGWFSGGIIVWSPSYNFAVSDVVVKNNRIYSLDSVGVYLNGASRLFSSDNTIQNNMIYDISADGAVLLNTTNGLIENNVVFDTHKRAGGYHVPLWTWGTEDAVIQYNEVFNTYPGGDAMAYDSDFRSEGTVIQYNYSHNNAGGFVLVINDGTDSTNVNRDTIIRYNISQNDHHTLFTLAGPIENTLIHNNTIYIPEHSNARVVASGTWGGWATDTYFYNNIIENHGSGGYSFGQSTNNVFDSNLYHGNHPAEVLAMDANKITTDPMLASPGSATIGRDTVTGYQLLQGSPAIGAGRVIPSNGSLDFWGNPVSAAVNPNIGAYEGPGLDPNNLPQLPPSPEEANLLLNPGFEAGDFTGWGYHYNSAAIVDTNVRTGDYAANLTNAGSGMEQNITGLKPNTMYILSGYGKGANSGSAVLGAKNYGEGYTDVRMSSTNYAWRDLAFRTGATYTSATIYLYKDSGTGEVSFDDLSLIEYGEVPGSAPVVLPPEPIFTEGESDEFNSSTLDPQWNWIREKGEKWSLSAQPGYMRIISEPGDIVDGQATARNILLTGAPEGDWTIDTRMVGLPTSQWSQGGLIVYENDQTYFRLTRLYGTGNQFQFTKQLNAVREHVEVTDPIESTVSYLRIVKQANTYSGYYSADGVEYTQVWTTQTADLVDPKIGLIVCAGTGLTAEFDYFRITDNGTNPPLPTPVTGVTLEPSELSLAVGETAVLSATVTPFDATNKAVTWSSDNLAVAQANANGTVTGVGIGTAVITVTTEDGTKTATSSVQVLPPPDPELQNIAPLADLSASSSHENGNFPPQHAVDGVRNQDASRWTTHTTLTGPHWLQMDWATYYEINHVKVWSGFKGLIGRQIADYEIQYWDGSGWQTAASVTSNEQDGRFDQYNDLVFPAVTTNKVRMYITKGSAYDDIARLFEIEVLGLEQEVIQVPISTITVSGENGASSVRVNETLQMMAAVIPANATEKSVTWSVVGVDGQVTDKASIDQNGLLTANTLGTVKIIATANDESGVSGESNITITPPSEQVAQNIAPLAELSVSSTNGNFTKEMATDGVKNQNASRWISAPNTPDPQWIQLDWDTNYEVHTVKVWSGFLSWMGSQIADFELQYWDGSAWQTAASVIGNTNDYYYGDYNDLSFPAVTTNKLRMYITKGSINDNMARLFEIEVWGG
jgi:parallel beta-helix repeat protein